MKNLIRLILALAIPSILENLFQVLIGFTDTYFISKIGTDAIVGVSGTNLLMNIFIAFYVALGVGATALISRAFGKEDKKLMKTTLSSSIFLAFIISTTLALCSILLAKPLLGLLGLEADIISKTLPYFITITLSTIPLALTTVLSSGLRSVGDTKTPMKVGMTVNIINVILNYILIFGIGSFTGLGLLGAGLASFIARLIGTMILFTRFTSKTSRTSNIIRLTLRDVFVIDGTLLTRICRIGIPAALEKLIMRSGQVLYGAMVIGIGKQVYAAHNIAGTIESFSYLPAMGFGVAAATLIGQNLGKGETETAKKIGWYCYMLSVGFMMVIALCFSIFAPLFAGLFTRDKTIVEYCTRALRIIVFVQPFLASTMVTTSALQGAGDTKFPMFTTLIGIWSIRVLGIYVLGVKLNLGITGVWLAIAFDIIVRGSILLVRYSKGKWTEIQLSK